MAVVADWDERTADDGTVILLPAVAPGLTPAGSAGAEAGQRGAGDAVVDRRGDAEQAGELATVADVGDDRRQRRDGRRR